MFDLCEAKKNGRKCKYPSAVIVLGVSLCDECFEKFEDNKEIETKRGVLTYEEGKAVLRTGKQQTPTTNLKGQLEICDFGGGCNE